MREIDSRLITETVSRLCQEANFLLGEDVLAALSEAHRQEESPLGREVLSQIIENARIAREERLPLCQDCGAALVFLEIGQDVHIMGGDVSRAVEAGVRRGYSEGCLRKSMVSQPFSQRVNTKDNTPPVIHMEIVPGDKVRIAVMPKGGGAENMSRLGMLQPGAGREGVIEFAARTVDEAGSKPCPPLIVGIGIGGTAEKAMLLAKKALLRPVGKPSPEPEVAALESDIRQRVNTLGIGPQGLGGKITALAVHIEVMPAHMASLPVAVNLQCHSARHKEAVL